MTIEAYQTTPQIETHSDLQLTVAPALAARALPPVIEWGPRKHADASNVEHVAYTHENHPDFND